MSTTSVRAATGSSAARSLSDPASGAYGTDTAPVR